MSVGDGFRFGFGFTLGSAVASLLLIPPALVLWAIVIAALLDVGS